VNSDGVDEEALSVPTEELDLYQSSKRAGALLARDAARAGAPIVTLYPGLVVGSGRLNESNVVTTMVRDHLLGRLVPLPAGGRCRWSFVHVDDVAEAHALALERGVLGKEYALSAESRTLRELFALVATLTGRPGPTLPLPRVLMWGVGAGEELLELAIGRPPRLLTRGAARLMSREWALSSDRAAREMGWQPRSLREALRETIAWLEREGHVPKGTLLPDASNRAAS
jgi:nucleoside-diphosphate-sugar epimerase